MHRDHVMRVARPTDNLSDIADMYRRGLGRSHGKTFEDLDGYRVVLQNAAWTNE